MKKMNFELIKWRQLREVLVGDTYNDGRLEEQNESEVGDDIGWQTKSETVSKGSASETGNSFLGST